MASAQSGAHAVAAARSAVATTEARVRGARADSLAAATRLNYAELRAPVSGVVQVFAARRGELVGPGSPVAVIVDPEHLWVRVAAPETDAGAVAVGDSLEVRLASGETSARACDQQGRRRRVRDAARREHVEARHSRHLVARCHSESQAHDRSRDDRVRRSADAPMSEQPAILIENAVKQYGKFTAVNDVSLSVATGETLGLLGPNGAGKSTLIRMLTTLVPITSGRIRLHGDDVTLEPDRARLSIGVIPQAMTTDTDLSIEENLSIYAKLYGVSREQRAR